MKRWYCEKCGLVYWAGEGIHCKIKSEIFNPVKHCENIIGPSNSWVDVWEKFKNNPLLEEISDELCEEGHYGCATHLIVFIEKLYNFYIESNEELNGG